MKPTLMLILSATLACAGETAEERSLRQQVEYYRAYRERMARSVQEDRDRQAEDRRHREAMEQRERIHREETRQLESLPKLPRLDCNHNTLPRFPWSTRK